MKGVSLPHDRIAAMTDKEYWNRDNFPATFDGQQIWTPDEFERYDPTLFDIMNRVYPDHHIPMDAYHAFDRPIPKRTGRAASP